ncbi:MAG: hypothetical protein V1891_03080 [bacterium]
MTKKIYKILASIIPIILFFPLMAVAQDSVKSMDALIDDVVIKNTDLSGKINFLPVIRNKNVNVKIGLGACWNNTPYEISVFDEIRNLTTIINGTAPAERDCNDWFNSSTAVPAQYTIAHTKNFAGQSVIFTYSGLIPYAQQLEMRFYEEIFRDASSSKLNNKYKGYVMIRAENKGQLYYISPVSKKAYHIVIPNHTRQLILGAGVGITNENIAKIQVGSACPATIPNCDFPSKYDQNFANKYKGYIFLQTEEKGEAWYVNPKDGKRYYLGAPENGYNILASTAIGISEKDFAELELAY